MPLKNRLMAACRAAIFLCLLTWAGAWTACIYAADAAPVDAALRRDLAQEISDGNIVVRYVPSIGRITHVARMGGRNMLWINPAPVRIMPMNWVNYGGEKLWPWPIDVVWKWPPPVAIDVGPYASKKLSAEPGFQWSGPVDAGTGLAARRQLSIKDGYIYNDYTLIRTADPLTGRHVSVASWSIVQADCENPAYVRLSPKPAGSVITPLGESPILTRACNSQWIEALPKSVGGGDGKIGIAGDAIAFSVGSDVLLMERIAGDDDPDLERHIAAQIYRYRDDTVSYMELELIGPRKQLKIGQSVTLQTRWRILSSEQFRKLLNP